MYPTLHSVLESRTQLPRFSVFGGFPYPTLSWRAAHSYRVSLYSVGFRTPHSTLCWRVGSTFLLSPFLSFRTLCLCFCRGPQDQTCSSLCPAAFRGGGWGCPRASVPIGIPRGVADGSPVPALPAPLLHTGSVTHSLLGAGALRWKEGRAAGALACCVLTACRAWTHSPTIKAVVSVVSEWETVMMAAADAHVSQACLGPGRLLAGLLEHPGG